jgi:hypothetical protein
MSQVHQRPFARCSNPPNLSAFDRCVFGFWSLFLDPHRIQRAAVIIRPSVIEKLAHDGFDPVCGARPLRREVERHIENPPAMKIV